MLAAEMTDRRHREARTPLVLVDARLARRRRTGVATYIRELDEAIRAARPGDVRVAFRYGPPGVPRRGSLTGLVNLLIDLLWLHVWLPLDALARRADVIHAPVNWAPWWAPCPTVVTVQDLSFERLPGAYPSGFRRYARLFARRSARRAGVVVATSQATARDLTDLYGVDPGRIRVIPIGVHPGAPEPPGGRAPFVLHVGEFEPRKRVPALIAGHRAYHRAAPPDPPPCALVLAGAGGSEEDAVRAAAGPECDLRGFVTDAELGELYRTATLLVMPSEYEGFGLPVAEAMAHGCPVLVADNSSLPEVGGPSALLIEDPSPAGIARALTAALADRESLGRRGARAREDAERFSWARAASATLDAYRAAAR
jgi:glycosyltransferase involved in cell wall biosynthesis